MILVIFLVVCTQSMATASSLNFGFYSHPERPGWHGETLAASACTEPGATTVRTCLQKFTGSFKQPEPVCLPLELCLIPSGLREWAVSSTPGGPSRAPWNSKRE